MKALVTGGSGFIGSNIVKKLVENGFQVTVLDNLSSGYICNIEELIQKKTIRFINADIRDSDAVEKACRGQDVVFHLAASVGRQKSIDNPVLDSSTNLLGAINVLEGMKKNSVHRIIYSSSAAIFGELITPTIDEQHPQNADSPYGVSKLAAEKMILAYSGLYDMTGICLRYFNIYGINQRFDPYGNVIPIFAKRIYSAKPLVIFGDGNQTRDFVNVQDIARVNLLAANSDTGTDVYNIGCGDSITINQLASMMQEYSGEQVTIQHAPERVGDVRDCKANADKVKRVLGFQVQIDLQHGLKDYLSWFKINCIA